MSRRAPAAREAGVEHVGRAGHALVHEARLGADMLGQIGQEGDDVMLGDALDRVDAVDVESSCPQRAPISPTMAAPRLLGGITPSSASASAGVRLDLEPDAEAGSRAPRWRTI
jgi:hypothetical protein